MAATNLFGGLAKICPYCCEPIESGQSRVTWGFEGPMFGMTVHRTCRDLNLGESRPAQCNPQEKP